MLTDSTDPHPPGSSDTEVPGRFEYAGLDRLFHERARLSILSSLVAHGEGVSFNDLKRLCKLTDGNLSRHLQMLVEATLIELHRGALHKRPLTLVRLTPVGKQRFLDYISCLESVVADALEGASSPEGQDEGTRFSPA
ncbi:transcriptional regulator [bacterium]|nr:transcriptional regulator [bacterium]